MTITISCLGSLHAVAVRHDLSSLRRHDLQGSSAGARHQLQLVPCPEVVLQNTKYFRCILTHSWFGSIRVVAPLFTSVYQNFGHRVQMSGELKGLLKFELCPFSCLRQQGIISVFYVAISQTQFCVYQLSMFPQHKKSQWISVKCASKLRKQMWSCCKGKYRTCWAQLFPHKFFQISQQAASLLPSLCHFLLVFCSASF